MKLSSETKAELLRRLEDPETQLGAFMMRKGNCFCLIGLIADIVDHNRWKPRGVANIGTAYDWPWKGFPGKGIYDGIPEENLSSEDVWNILTVSDEILDRNAADHRTELVTWVEENL